MSNQAETISADFTRLIPSAPPFRGRPTARRGMLPVGGPTAIATQSAAAFRVVLLHLPPRHFSAWCGDGCRDRVDLRSRQYWLPVAGGSFP